MKNKNATRSVGRPAYVVKWPRGKFTFDSLCVHNGVDPVSGKGEHCTALTLRKNMMKDAARKSKSEVVRLKNEVRKSKSEKGLGRKPFVFIRRDKLAALKAAELSTVAVEIAPAVAPTEDIAPAPIAEVVTDSTSDTLSAYEATKAALLA